MRVLNEARNKWHSILRALGVPETMLINKHGPCPWCGGRDRYRWDNKEGKGTYYCNSCGAGNGFKLLMLYHGWDEEKARKEIIGVLGGAREEKPRRISGKNTRQRLRYAFSGAKRDAPEIDQYLSSRGLRTKVRSLLFNPKTQYQAGVYHPAMLALVVDLEGEPITIHRTYLADVEVRKKTMVPLKPMSEGAVIRLFKAGDTLGVAEGIETAIAAHEMWGIPVWSTLNAEMLQKFRPPEGVKKVVVFGDNDKSFHGQKSAYELAFALARMKDPPDVEVHIPVVLGADWLDILNDRRAKR